MWQREAILHSAWNVVLNLFCESSGCSLHSHCNCLHLILRYFFREQRFLVVALFLGLTFHCSLDSLSLPHFAVEDRNLSLTNGEANEADEIDLWISQEISSSSS